MTSSKEAPFLAYLEENQELNKAAMASSVEKSKQARGFEVLPTREAELKKMAIRVEDKVKEICASKANR
ncbi:hypothetical protein ACE6H2_028747 [Prunus campanulata]